MATCYADSTGWNRPKADLTQTYNPVIQSITLNLPYDLSDADWEKVAAVYRAMDGWCEEHSSWFGPQDSERFIAASVEPGGLLVEGNIDPLLFRGWVTKLCAKLTAALGKEVYDAEV